MADKIKTMTLVTWEGLPDTMGSPPYQMVRKWKVVKVTDSIAYAPGQELDKATVETLTAASDWKITVVAK